MLCIQLLFIWAERAHLECTMLFCAFTSTQSTKNSALHTKNLIELYIQGGWPICANLPLLDDGLGNLDIGISVCIISRPLLQYIHIFLKIKEYWGKNI